MSQGDARVIAGRWLVAPLRKAVDAALEGRAPAEQVQVMLGTCRKVEQHHGCESCGQKPAGRGAALVLGSPETMAATFVRPSTMLRAPVLCAACQDLEDAVLVPLLKRAEEQQLAALRRKAGQN